MELPEPFDLDERQFLQGIDLELDIDDIFAKTLEQVLEDFNRYASYDITPQDERIFPSLFEPGYKFQDVPAGILLLCPEGKIAGGYLSCDLVLGKQHRGLGLGIEMVIERCLRDGENPVLNLDSASYSRKGLRSHQMAWHHARQNPEETQKRLSRWEGADQ
jgi:hypothetical protein